MDILREIELKQSLQRRDERINELELALQVSGRVIAALGMEIFKARRQGMLAAGMTPAAADAQADYELAELILKAGEEVQGG